MIDGYSMVGRLVTIRQPDRMCVSEKLFGLVLSG